MQHGVLRQQTDAEAPRDNRRTVAFDVLAPTYDRDFTRSALGAALRAFVWPRLERNFRGCSRVLELGCGTGEDAIKLASVGLRVLAIDYSSEMLRIARSKAREAGCEKKIEFLQGSLEEFGTLPQSQIFDGVHSNFGVINCVRALPALVAELARRLAPGAPLVWVPMGRHVPCEWLWYLARGEARKAFRRLPRANLEWRGLQLCYPTPAEMRSILKFSFEVTRVRPLGCALPPTFAVEWLNRSPRTLRVLTRLEGFAQRFGLLANWADHYIVEARRLPYDTVADDSFMSYAKRKRE